MSIVSRYFFLLIWLSLVIVGDVTAVSNPDGGQSWLSTAEMELRRWQNDHKQWQIKSPSFEQLEERQNSLLKMKQEVDACIARVGSQVNTQQEKLDALGEEKADDATELKQLRGELQKQKALLESEWSSCRLLGLNIRELQDAHRILRKSLIAQKFSYRERPVWEIAQTLGKEPFFKTSPAFQIKFGLWPTVFFAMAVFLVMFPLTMWILKLINNSQSKEKSQKGEGRDQTFFSTYTIRLPWIVSFAVLSLFSYFTIGKLVSSILLALVFSMLFTPLVNLLLCNLLATCKKSLPARTLLYISLVGFAAQAGGVEIMISTDGYTVLQALYYSLLMVLSLWLVWVLIKDKPFRLLGLTVIPAVLVLVVGPVAMWNGFYSLSDVLTPGVYGTFAGAFLAWTVYRSGSYFFDTLEPGTPNTGEGIRQFLGYKKAEVIPGLLIGRWLLILTIGGSFFYWLLFTWQVPHSEINSVNAYFTDGFDVGSMTIVPSKIIAALLVFFLLLTFARWLRNKLNDRWLTRTKLDAGARESIVLLTTYVIVGVALITALSMAGVNFQNIAIVAGALSVGIGFGLQNIVNNFVSGLILLFERPVKPGDWIVVGATEGNVKKISIRYTLIQTFDRADVLVPNSELISGQMTNWMLRDSMGRVIVPVGIAYGSDTQQVKDILFKIASKHPLVLMNDWRVSPPKVLFMGFGDSALNFELRCFIKDVENRLTVRSDLLFSIDDEFRKAGIDIPFPQRVVHFPGESDVAGTKNKPGPHE